MSVLCMFFVLKIFLIKDAMFTEQLSPKLLEMSLMRINSLLSELANKIIIERNILYKVDNETEKELEPVTCKVPQQSQAPRTTKKRIIRKRVKRKKRTKKVTKQIKRLNRPHNRMNPIQKPTTIKITTQLTGETTKGKANLSQMLQDIYLENTHGVIPWNGSYMWSDNAIQNNQTYKIQPRRMTNNFKPFIKYNKLIQHLISKHPKLFHKLVMHYEHSQRQKRRYSRQKKHYHKHHDNKGSRYKYSEPDLSKNKEEENISITDIAESEVSSKSHEQFIQIEHLNEPVNSKSHKVLLRTFHIKNKINASMPVRQFITNNYTVGIPRKFYNKKVNLLNMSQMYITTKTFHLNNTVLKNIVEDSSYSDEEIYLRTMLMDAFFHGNGSSAKDNI